MAKQMILAAFVALMAIGAEARVFTSNEGLQLQVSRNMEQCAQVAVTTAAEQGIELDTTRYGFGVAQNGGDTYYDRYTAFYLPVSGLYNGACYVVDTDKHCEVTKAYLLDQPRWYSRCPSLPNVQ